MQRICSLLVDGGVPFDAPLSERAIADAIGIGRMPVREAVRDLAREGVVTVEPGRGTFLRRLDAAQVTELLEVRLAIECTGARLAAEKGYIGELPDIVTSLQELRTGSFVGKRIALAEALGDRVHGALIEGAGNATLSSLYAGLRLRIGISLRLVQRRDVERIRETVDEHLAIAEAVLAGSADAAVRTLQAHLRRGHAVTMLNFADKIAPRADTASSRPRPAMARPRGRPRL
jgi:DNA-binding GntR family transcriptional regulator